MIGVFFCKNRCEKSVRGSIFIHPSGIDFDIFSVKNICLSSLWLIFINNAKIKILPSFFHKKLDYFKNPLNSSMKFLL